MRVNTTESTAPPSPPTTSSPPPNQSKFPTTLLDFQRMFYAKQFADAGVCDPSQFVATTTSVNLTSQSGNHGPTVFNPKIVVAAAACQAAAVAAALRSVGERFGEEGRRRRGEDQEEDENSGVRERGNGE